MKQVTVLVSRRGEQARAKRAPCRMPLWEALPAVRGFVGGFVVSAGAASAERAEWRVEPPSMRLMPLRGVLNGGGYERRR
jgi:hypothetical protein